MTTAIEEESKCAVCGHVSKQWVMMSSSAFGSPSLDSRPPAPHGYNLQLWIQTCPSCGYCAPQISEDIKDSLEIVRTDHYRKQLDNPGFPKLANAFLCGSMLKEVVDNFAGAGSACLYAAWECDDKNNDTGARICREKAAILLQKAIESGQKFADDAGAEEAIMVDLLRRSGQFQLALGMCEQGLSKEPEEIISSILLFQKKLISQSDIGCHMVTEAEAEGGTQDPDDFDARLRRFEEMARDILE